ncbi:MAG: winged helix-turn-helix transcriptional regulator [Clostridia bacterium]|nr:winged helix-turn-helix transcriptional regulator [Clostridia bacterium]
MASKAQVFEVMAKLQDCSPLEAFRHIDEINSGMGYIMLRLYNAKNEVFAIDISKDMQISRARVTMLIRKLISKGFAVKQRSKTDARKEIITITNKGRDEVNTIKQKILGDVNKLIDKLGFDKVNQFLEISKEIHETLHG